MQDSNFRMSNSERGRKPKNLVVPSLEEDSAERKRLLNVLAQRRYRRRKKEHLQRLEKLNDQEFSLLSPDPEDSGAPSSYDDTEEPQLTGSLPGVLNSSNVSGKVDYPDLTSIHARVSGHGYDHSHQDLSNTATDLLTDTWTLPSAYDDLPGFAPGSLEAFETSLTFAQPLYSASPSMTPTIIPSYTTVSSTSVSPQTSLDFPDEAYIPVKELSLLRGTFSIAERIGCDSIIWTLDANSTFHNSAASLHTHLPPNLRPTRVQLMYAHHPALDILPWPAVRDRLIIMLAQPEKVRPPSARSPTALLEFIYDLEDPFEGARIHGDDPYTDENWEVGEKVFQNWWWALDRRVLHRSNQLRLARGAALLGSKNRIQEID